MDEVNANRCIAFNGTRRIAVGTLADVAAATKELIDNDRYASVLIFDVITSELIEVDFRGTISDVLQRLERLAKTVTALSPSVDAEQDARRGPGRPRLGVVAREVTLLPRHWVWLNSQAGGASIALRKLVDEARKANVGKDRLRATRDAAYKFMSALAGDFPGFEEATRALFAGNRDQFEEYVGCWPDDVREHALALAFGPSGDCEPGTNNASLQELVHLRKN